MRSTLLHKPNAPLLWHLLHQLKSLRSVLFREYLTCRKPKCNVVSGASDEVSLLRINIDFHHVHCSHGGSTSHCFLYAGPKHEGKESAAPKVNRETPRRVSSRKGDHLRFGGGMRKFRGVFWERMGRGEPGMLQEGRERKDFHRSSRQSGREGKEGPATGNIGQEERGKCRDWCNGKRGRAEWGSWINFIGRWMRKMKERNESKTWQQEE